MAQAKSVPTKAANFGVSINKTFKTAVKSRKGAG